MVQAKTIVKSKNSLAPQIELQAAIEKRVVLVIVRDPEDDIPLSQCQVKGEEFPELRNIKEF